MIRLEQLTKRYGSFTAVQGIDLEIPAGTLYAFLGPNGAGKTTTMRMIAGILRPTSGRVEVAGIDVVQDPVRAKASMGFIPDRPYVYDKLGGAEFVFDTRNTGTGGFSIFSYNGSSWINLFKVDVSGNVNISGLTASQLVFTDASKNLVSTCTSAAVASAVSDETGTGSLVFSSNPTFTAATFNGDVNIYGLASSTQLRSPSSTLGTVSVTGAINASSTLTASGAFTSFVDVVDVGAGHGMPVEEHDRVCQAIALVRLHPGLDARAARQYGQRHEWYRHFKNKFHAHIPSLSRLSGSEP